MSPSMHSKVQNFPCSGHFKTALTVATGMANWPADYAADGMPMFFPLSDSPWAGTPCTMAGAKGLCSEDGMLHRFPLCKPSSMEVDASDTDIAWKRFKAPRACSVPPAPWVIPDSGPLPPGTFEGESKGWWFRIDSKWISVKG